VHRELGHLIFETKCVPHPMQVPSLANASRKRPTCHIILHVAAKRSQLFFIWQIFTSEKELSDCPNTAQKVMTHCKETCLQDTPIELETGIHTIWASKSNNLPNF
jgi:hypothetical protein